MITLSPLFKVSGSASGSYANLAYEPLADPLLTELGLSCIRFWELSGHLELDRRVTDEQHMMHYIRHQSYLSDREVQHLHIIRT